MPISRQEARAILEEMTEAESLLRHARSVELVMEAMADHFGEDREKWAITGMLHDADYEKYPDRHPGVIVEKLESIGETEIAHAIKGHYTIWGVPRNTLMDKAIIAADELTGFIYAAALVRPTLIVGMTARSVKKKLKTKTFAAKVDREEVKRGAELLSWEMDTLINFIIGVLQENKAELGLEV